MSELQGQGMTPGIVVPPFQPQSTQQTDNTQQPDLSSLSEFAQGILKDIPEADRGVVARYVKDWDGNVTKKFQEIHSQYEPYKKLGDVESLEEAMYYRTMLQNDPDTFVQMLQEAIEEARMNGDLDPNEEFDPGQGGGNNAPAGIAPEIEQRFGQLEKMIGGFFEQFQGFTSQYTEQQQMQQLDKILADLHSAHGDFDDEWVLLQIENGAEPEAAIEAWNEKIVKKFGSSPQRLAPVIPSTNGAVGQQNQVDPSKLSKEDRKAFGAAILNANLRD